MKWMPVSRATLRRSACETSNKCRKVLDAAHVRDASANFAQKLRSYRGTHGARPWLFRADGNGYARHHVSGDLRSNDADSLIAAAEAGHGLVLFPTWLLHVPLRDGRLRPLLTDWQALSDLEDGAIHMLFPENRRRSLKVTAFLDFMSETVGRQPYWDSLVESEANG